MGRIRPYGVDRLIFAILLGRDGDGVQQVIDVPA